jgi:hypothetical protein
VVHGLGGIEQLGQADRFGDAAEAKGGEIPAYLWAMNSKRSRRTRLPGEPRAQLGILSRPRPGGVSGDTPASCAPETTSGAVAN